ELEKREPVIAPAPAALERQARLCQACGDLPPARAGPAARGCPVMPFPASPAPIATRRLAVEGKRWDFVAAVLVLGFIVFLAQTRAWVFEPLAELKPAPVSLDPANLAGYAARTTLRMLAALILSLLFTFTYATVAAKNRRAEQLLIPLLDILQS